MQIKDMKPGEVFVVCPRSGARDWRYLVVRKTHLEIEVIAFPWLQEPAVETYALGAVGDIKVDKEPLDGALFVEWVRYLKETVDAA